MMVGASLGISPGRAAAVWSERVWTQHRLTDRVGPMCQIPVRTPFFHHTLTGSVPVCGF